LILQCVYASSDFDTQTFADREPSLDPSLDPKEFRLWEGLINVLTSTFPGRIIKATDLPVTEEAAANVGNGALTNDRTVTADPWVGC
jgi:hypothetical protein